MPFVVASYLGLHGQQTDMPLEHQLGGQHLNTSKERLLFNAGEQSPAIQMCGLVPHVMDCLNDCA